jgi:hypothetical protein
MFFLPLAMPPPEMLLIWPAGFLFILVITAIFVTATRKSRKQSEQNRRAGLGITAILCGPLLGACLAWLANQGGYVHPADVKYTYVTLTIIGSIAGFVAGIFFAITALFCPRGSGEKAVLTKSADLLDDC